jgi:hypothetical protein
MRSIPPLSLTTARLPALVAACFTTLCIPLAPSLTSSALAQSRAASTAPAARPMSAPLLELADEPFRLDAVGLSMMLPVGASAESSSAGGDVTARIVPRDKTWLLNIRTPRLTGDLNLTTDDLLEQIAVHIASASGEQFKATGRTSLPGSGNTAKYNDLASFRARLLGEPQTVTINGRQASRVYVSLPPVNQTPATVRGVTIFQTGPTQYVVMDLTVIAEEFERSKPIYETIVATSDFVDDADLTMRRGAAIEMGKRLIEGLKPEDYRTAIAANSERWLRLYRPSTTGNLRDDEELGYARIRAKIGPRSDVADASGPAGNADGYIVQIDVRLLAGEGRIIDTRGIYFMTPDRTEEVWQLSQAARKDGQTFTTIESGGRVDKSITIRIEGQARAPMTNKPIIQGEGYISIVEDMLVPRFLIAQAIPGEFGFYSYRSESATIRYRRDVLEKDPKDPNVWVLTTNRGDDRVSQVSRYTQTGELLQTVLPDRNIWEPVTPQKILDLWKSKGLPQD